MIEKILVMVTSFEFFIVLGIILFLIFFIGGIHSLVLKLKERKFQGKVKQKDEEIEQLKQHQENFNEKATEILRSAIELLNTDEQKKRDEQIATLKMENQELKANLEVMKSKAIDSGKGWFGTKSGNQEKIQSMVEEIFTLNGEIVRLNNEIERNRSKHNREVEEIMAQNSSLGMSNLRYSRAMLQVFLEKPQAKTLFQELEQKGELEYDNNIESAPDNS